MNRTEQPGRDASRGAPSAVRALVEPRRAELEALCRRYEVKRLELFGSAAVGPFDPERSDLDFLVEFLPEAEPNLAERFLDLIAALRELFHCEVDLVMTRAIRNPYFRQTADRTRVTLYAT